MSPIIDYTRRGLKNCYMKDQQCWSYIYHLDGRANPNQSVPAGDSFYSLNVILGFAAAGKETWENDYNLPELLQINAARLFTLKAPTYALGMALWASAELDMPLEAQTATSIRNFIKNRNHWACFRAQDIGMILTGICEQKHRGNSEYDEEAHALFQYIKTRYLSSSTLFFDEACGLRRMFSSFATQAYLTTACYHYGMRYGSEEALAIADTTTRKLISMQGPNGEWPWFYFTPKGMVVDNYEVYSVHQYGMAPLFLTFAQARGLPGAKEAMLKGAQWIFGVNQLQRSMMIPELGMFYRSIIRRGELTNKNKRAMRAIINGVTGNSDPFASPDSLTLRLECRSYELGWLLHALGQRTDMQEITHHPAFK